MFLINADDSLFELPADRNVLIGRAGVNQIVLNDRLVSRVHAQIAPGAKGPVLTDRGSANGTQVNGRATREAVLKHGDTVCIGKTLFQVFRGTRADAQAWVRRRHTDTKSDKTLVGLNVNSIRVTDMIGDLSAFSLVSLLQTLVQQGQNGSLTLTLAGEWMGKIFFVNGSLVYAETCTGLKNQAAVFELMALGHGQFVFQPGVKPPAMGITDNPAALILEGCRRLDERGSLKTH